MNDLIDVELKEEFFREFLDLSQDVETYLLKLEQEPDNLDFVRELFRPFHTIKSNSGLINEKEIMQVSQLAESVLDEVRQGRQKLTESMLEASLKSIDVIREISLYRDARPLQPKIDEIVSELKEILSDFEDQGKADSDISTQKNAMPSSMQNRLLNYRFPYEKAIDCTLQLENLSEIIDKMRYQRNCFDFLPDLFDCILELSFHVSNNKVLENINNLLKYLEMYLVVLNLDDSTLYSVEKWELLDKFRDDIMRAFYPLLLKSLKIKVLYYNETNDIEELKTIIKRYISEDNPFTVDNFILNLNVHRIPSQKEIYFLLELLSEYKGKITLVQRYLGQKEFWHSIAMLVDEMQIIKKNFWKAIFSIARNSKG